MRTTFALIGLACWLGATSCGDTGRPAHGARDAPQPALPEEILFRANDASFNTRYFAAVKDGSLWLKEKADGEGEWVDLGDSLPDDLAGNVTQIAMDDEHILALNAEREIYTMWSALGEISGFRWQKAWGFPFWNGPGMRLPDDLMKWDFSVVSIPQDRNWHDPNGNTFRIGDAKCSHIVMLRGEGQWITFNDPWLPTDLSYGIGAPKRCRFRSVNLSASGSTTFLINAYGDMYTRLFDFDISGLDEFIDLLYGYAYEDQSAAARPKIQLPPEDWTRQPKIRGRITDRISIHKQGRREDCWDRLLRVEGLDAGGRTGYYEKAITATRSEDWTFHRTGMRLRGTLLDNRVEDCSDETLGPSEDLRFSVNMERLAVLDPEDYTDWAGEILDFNGYCPPHTLRVHVAEGRQFDLLLHTTESIRILPRARGLDDEPRKFLGAVEVPAALHDSLDHQEPKIRDFVNGYLDGQRFTRIELYGTLEEIELRLKQGTHVAHVFRFRHAPP